MQQVKKEAEIFFRVEFAKIFIDHEATETLIAAVMRFLENPENDIHVTMNSITKEQAEAVRQLLLCFRNNLHDEIAAIGNRRTSGRFH